MTSLHNMRREIHGISWRFLFLVWLLVGNCDWDSSTNGSVCEWSYFCIRNDNRIVLRLCQVADSGWKASQSSNCFSYICGFVCWFCRNAKFCSAVRTKLWWKSYSHQLLMFMFSWAVTDNSHRTHMKYSKFFFHKKNLRPIWFGLFQTNFWICYFSLRQVVEMLLLLCCATKCNSENKLQAGWVKAHTDVYNYLMQCIF